MSSVLCNICREVFGVEDDVWATRCGHVFHKNCIHRWIVHNDTCPQCRQACRQYDLSRLYLNMDDCSSKTESGAMECQNNVATWLTAELAQQLQQRQIGSSKINVAIQVIGTGAGNAFMKIKQTTNSIFPTEAVENTLPAPKKAAENAAKTAGDLPQKQKGKIEATSSYTGAMPKRSKDLLKKTVTSRPVPACADNSKNEKKSLASNLSAGALGKPNLPSAKNSKTTAVAAAAAGSTGAVRKTTVAKASTLNVKFPIENKKSPLKMKVPATSTGAIRKTIVAKSSSSTGAIPKKPAADRQVSAQGGSSMPLTQPKTTKTKTENKIFKHPKPWQ